MLICVQKINFITQFFLKILQRNSKLAILSNFGMPNFICKWKIKFILHVFLEILPRYCKLVVLGTLGMPGYANPKLFYQLVENLRVYLQARNQPPMLFWRYCKDMQTSYFGFFGHASMHTLKLSYQLVQDFYVYLNAKNKLHHSLLSWDITF